MNLPHNLIPGRFVRRLNRVAALVTVDGVEVYAYGCRVSEHSITLDGPLPVRL
ncbi:MAG: hypothetical protein Q8O40_13485 [Chloroflexota bacterium]|nr:hypothetical protein [Chloroflexota bacterium]